MATTSSPGWERFGDSTARFDNRWVGRVAVRWEGQVHVVQACTDNSIVLTNQPAEYWMMEGRFGRPWLDYIGAGEDEPGAVLSGVKELAGLSPDELLELGFRAVVTLDGENAPSVLFQGDRVREASFGDPSLSVQVVQEDRLELLLDRTEELLLSQPGTSSNPARIRLTVCRENETVFVQEHDAQTGTLIDKRPLTEKDLLMYFPFTPDVYWPLALVVAKYAKELLDGFLTPDVLAAGPVPNGRCDDYFTDLIPLSEWWTGFNSEIEEGLSLASVEECLRGPESLEAAIQMNVMAYLEARSLPSSPQFLSFVQFREHVSPRCKADIARVARGWLKRFMESDLAIFDEKTRGEVFRIVDEAREQRLSKEDVGKKIVEMFAVKESEEESSPSLF